MASTAPLQGTDLIDCARASAKEGIAVAVERCGYGNDLATFERELQKAAEHMGVKIDSFNDLLKSSEVRPELGIEIAPESTTQL